MVSKKLIKRCSFVETVHDVTFSKIIRLSGFIKIIWQRFFNVKSQN